MTGPHGSNCAEPLTPQSRTRRLVIRGLLLLTLFALLLPTWSDGAPRTHPGAVVARTDVALGLVQWGVPTADGATLVAGTSRYGTFYAASVSDTGSVLWRDDYNVEGYDVAYVVDASATSAGAASVLIERSAAGTGQVGKTLVRYEPGGKRAWSHEFESSCTPTALAVDKSGNTIVAGESRVGTKPPDAYVAKIGADGHLVWQRVYSGRFGPAYGDTAQDVAVDSAGNVYVSGNTFGGSSRQSDALLLKYSPHGGLLWVRMYHRPRSRTAPNKCDTARNVTVDARGDIVLGGWSHLAPRDWDFLALKYSSAGALKWAGTYAGTKAGGRDLATLLGTDRQGNVYLAGESEGPKGRDFAVVGFSAAGARMFAYRFDGADHLEDVPSAMTVSSDGIVYVAGETWTARRQSEFGIVAVAKNGARRWVQRWGAGPYQDTPHAIWFDRRGRLAVAGRVTTGERVWDFQGAILRLTP